jgi:hypothetical protein
MQSVLLRSILKSAEKNITEKMAKLLEELRLVTNILKKSKNQRGKAQIRHVQFWCKTQHMVPYHDITGMLHKQPIYGLLVVGTSCF